MNRCDSCGKHFSGVRSFDDHRTGEFAQTAFKHGKVTHLAKPSTRRCMTTEEMLQSGFASEIKNPKEGERVEWFIAKDRERLLRVYGAKNRVSEGETEEEEAEDVEVVQGRLAYD